MDLPIHPFKIKTEPHEIPRVYKAYIVLHHYSLASVSLQWCHNERNGVSNHRRLDCLLNRCSGADQRKHQSCSSLAFGRGIHRWPGNLSEYKKHFFKKTHMEVFSAIYFCSVLNFLIYKHRIINIDFCETVSSSLTMCFDIAVWGGVCHFSIIGIP